MKNEKKIRSWSIVALVVGTTCLFASRSYSAPPPAADTFKAKCAMCHGTDGAGNTPMGQRLKIKDLRSPEVQKQSDAELTAIIANGKPPMPAYAKTLSADDIQALVAYIRSIAKS